MFFPRPTLSTVGTQRRPLRLSPFQRGTWGAVILALAPCLAHGDAIERPIADNIRFLRSHVLPADLPGSDIKTGPIVLDLRYTLAEAEAAVALDAWLKFRATPRTPVVILINPDTAPALRELFQPTKKHAHVITMGRAAAEMNPDISIQISAEDERRAYDALENGSTIAALTVENADKPRVDEASIMRSRSENGGVLADASALDDLAPGEKKAAPAPPLPIDHVLQRAIHLQHALQALKRS